MEFWKLVNKNKHLVMPGVLAFALISLLTITQNVSKLVLIVIWGYFLIMQFFSSLISTKISLCMFIRKRIQMAS